MRKYWNLFAAFFRASHLTFGGGPAMIPLIRVEAVNKFKWVNEEEFADIVAVSTALPAPLVTKLAAMIGYRIGGWLGVLVAEAGVVLPTTLVVVLLGNLIMQFADSAALEAMLTGVRPVVIVLLLQAAWSIGKKAFVDWLMWVFGVAAFGLVLLAPWIHPAFLVAGSMVLSYIFYRKLIKT